MTESISSSPADRTRFIRARIPAGGLFTGQDWRISPTPFPIEPALARELETLGRVLLQFYRAVNLLYRQSAAGKQPAWIAQWLDRGKPAPLIELQRSPAFKNEVPRVIRPDLLLTESGVSVTELDSVPGGIGLTAWLNQTYSLLPGPKSKVQSPESEVQGSRFKVPSSRSDEVAVEKEIIHSAIRNPQSAIQNPQPSTLNPQPPDLIGGPDGMVRGFAGIFGDAPRVHVLVSEESATYRPEMVWLCEQAGSSRFHVQSSKFSDFSDGDAVYRFFEMFDLANVENAAAIFDLAREKRIRLTPPPKPVLEEKMLFALLWNRNLRGFWRQELGEGFWNRLLRLVPYTWIVDPEPLPPQAAIPELDLTDWHQLKALSQRERELILKVSGFSDRAWGARSVFLGSDLSHADWSTAVDTAIASFDRSPYVLQRYHKPRIVQVEWFDFPRGQLVPMAGRVRLCPYYFVAGDGDAARAQLGGVLATICPADKKIIHGMKEAVLAPCAVWS